MPQDVVARDVVLSPRKQRHEPAPWNAELDPREQRFIELFIETNNGTRSALAAGYGRNLNTAGNIAHGLLRRPKIKNAIDQRNAQIMAELDFTPDRIIRELAKVAGANAADFVSIDDDGKPHLDLTGVKRAQMAAVATVDSETTEFGVKARIKTHDKLKALDMLAKMATLYPAERTELTGADGGPIQSTTLNVHKMDIASLEPEQREQLRGVLLALKAKHEAESSESEDGS